MTRQDIQELYKRERRRIKSLIRRASKEGYTLTKDIKVDVKRPTLATIRRLKSIKAKDINRLLEKVDTTTGEVITRAKDIIRKRWKKPPEPPSGPDYYPPEPPSGPDYFPPEPLDELDMIISEAEAIADEISKAPYEYPYQQDIATLVTMTIHQAVDEIKAKVKTDTAVKIQAEKLRDLLSADILHKEGYVDYNLDEAREWAMRVFAVSSLIDSDKSEKLINAYLDTTESMAAKLAKQDDEKKSYVSIL